MRVPGFNATPEQLWRWFKVPGSKAEIELKLVTRDEWSQYGKIEDASLRVAHVAKNWFRAFRDLQDCNGVEIPNTEENRCVILNLDMDLWGLVITKLGMVIGWRDEGKGDSGSVS